MFLLGINALIAMVVPKGSLRDNTTRIPPGREEVFQGPIRTGKHCNEPSRAG